MKYRWNRRLNLITFFYDPRRALLTTFNVVFSSML